MKKVFTAVLTISFITTQAQVFKQKEPLVHTFSIVARDVATGEMAVGVQSHWFSVGTAVPWADAGVGAVATQSFVDKSYGPKALALLNQGYTAQEALDSLTRADAGRDVRQVAIVDNKGNVAAHTGKKCIQYANHITGINFSVQSNMMLGSKVCTLSNMMLGSKVCENMKTAFEQSAKKPLAERVLLALEAAQNAGGDIRGMQSAALIVVPGKATELWNNKTIDLRVDDNSKPLVELRRLYNTYLAYEHMNNGDLAVEKNDMLLAMKEYNTAMKMFPQNLEMKYWTAITLANNKQIDKAATILQTIYTKDKNWRELTKRLPAVGLLKVSELELKKLTK